MLLQFLSRVRAGAAAVFSEVLSISTLVSWIVTSIVVASAGPFGTFMAQPFLWRVLYWGGVVAVAIVLAVSLRTLWRAILSNRSMIGEDVAVAVSLAAIFGPLIVMLNRYLGGEGMGVGIAIFNVFCIAVCIIAARRTLERQAAAQITEARPERDRLLKRIPDLKEQRLSRISSDNHHIRIITDCGAEHRLLMRLRDAVEEVDVEPGLWVHRSHWVALSEIAKVAREGNREMVELNDGDRLPVGPKYRENLIEAGVINA